MTTIATMQEIDRLARAGFRHKEISAKLGIPQSTVTKLVAKFRGIKSKKREKTEAAK